MRQVDHRAHGGDEFVDLTFRDHQRRRDLQHHIIIAANLREHVFVAKQAHDQDLAEHGGMNAAEGLERQAQAHVLRRLKLDAREHARAAHRFHHLVRRQRFRKAAAQFVAQGFGALAEPLLLQHVEGCQAGAHRQAVLAERRGVHEGAAQRAEDRVRNRLGHEHRTYRHEAAGERFGEHHDIRLHAVAVRRQERAGAVHARLHFVEHQ